MCLNKSLQWQQNGTCGLVDVGYFIILSWFSSCSLPSIKKVNLCRFECSLFGSLVSFVYHMRHFCDLISCDNLITHPTKLKHSDRVLPNSWSCSAGRQIGMQKLEFLRERSTVGSLGILRSSVWSLLKRIG